MTRLLPAQRMRGVRGLARYLHALDPATEIPPVDLLLARKYRPSPYIYSDDEIAALVHAAGQLRPRLRAVAPRLESTRAGV